MVKVLIDGKEYEGKYVSVTSWYESKLNFVDAIPTSYYWDELKVEKEESKQVFVSVPKEIQFVTDYEGGIFLKVGNHYLSWSKSHNNWGFAGENKECPIKLDLVDCVLVPTKREELKAGDWAFNWYPNSHQEMETLLVCTSNYSLILNEEKSVRVNAEGDQVWITNLFSNNDWFKVVPRSELK